MRLAAVALLLAAGCSDLLGEAGGPCNRRGQCRPGLVCGADGKCARLEPAGPDAGSFDATSFPDAAPERCELPVPLGSLEDGGVPCAARDSGLPGYASISPGTFTMGSPAGELGHSASEAQHQATITRSFWLKATEVTQCEWRSITGTNPSFFGSCGGQCPVERVSWWEAIAYLNALSAREGLDACYATTGCHGRPGGGCGGLSNCESDYACDTVHFAGLGCNGYRLPTEAEWEFAARAGTTSTFWNGPLTEPLCGDTGLDEIAWYCGTSSMKTHFVGTKPANPWCLSDVHGSVFELVTDAFGDYPAGPVSDPLGPATGGDRVMRGGSWFVEAQSCRSARRYSVSPTSRLSGVGFRPARSHP